MLRCSTSNTFVRFTSGPVRWIVYNILTVYPSVQNDIIFHARNFCYDLSMFQEEIKGALELVKIEPFR